MHLLLLLLKIFRILINTIFPLFSFKLFNSLTFFANFIFILLFMLTSRWFLQKLRTSPVRTSPVRRRLTLVASHHVRPVFLLFWFLYLILCLSSFYFIATQDSELQLIKYYTKAEADVEIGRRAHKTVGCMNKATTVAIITSSYGTRTFY